MPFDLLANRFNRGMETEKFVGDRLVFARQAKQQVLSLDVRRAELAGLISGEENNAPCLFCIAFEHISPSEDGWWKLVNFPPLPLRLTRVQKCESSLLKMHDPRHRTHAHFELKCSKRLC